MQLAVLLTHLRPCPRPPLGGACGVVTGLPGVRPILGAVFAVDGPVGAVVERLHALHHPGLVAELPAGLTAGTPLLHHPPVSTAVSLRKVFLSHSNYIFLLRLLNSTYNISQGGHMEPKPYVQLPLLTLH